MSTYWRRSREFSGSLYFLPLRRLRSNFSRFLGKVTWPMRLPGLFFTVKDVEYAVESPPAAREFNRMVPKTIYRRSGTMFN